MKYKIVKDIFLNFFNLKKHKILPSFPIYLDNDPSIFFVNSGMNHFKDFLLGNKKPDYSRVANIQRCLRVTGKHNDFEQVGYDNYHHTMFEMMGNWSFGDYSRNKAIEWALELLINIYGITKNDIYITVFKGSNSYKLPIDNETLTCWKKFIDNDHILLFGEKYNFWEMGNNGPCGPCTEIHIDLRNKKEKLDIPGKYLINKNHPRVIEIWNIVFIEFFRDEYNNLIPLNIKHVDTGMGLERLCMILQQKNSSYETDIFSDIIKKIKEKLTIYNNTYEQNISINILADHIRSVVFSIYDGKIPSNNKEGYIIRKILRRSIMYINQFLYIKDPFIYKIADYFIEKQNIFLPGFKIKKKRIIKIIENEEILFHDVIQNGNKKIYDIIKKTKIDNKLIINGNEIFKLYDTYGFPIEISKIIAKNNNLLIDENCFNKKLMEQKIRSKNKHKNIIKTNWIQLSVNYNRKILYENNFIGYNYIYCIINIVKYREVINKNVNNTSSYYQLVFDKTPFYPESGGQVGDTGYIIYKDKRFYIENTKKEGDLIVHIVHKLPPINKLIKFKVFVNETKRKNIEKNHTATHLLHFALKKILGKNVIQQGSLINENYLRFDFSYEKPISFSILNEIENLVQELIFNNISIDEKYLSFNDIKKYPNCIYNKKFLDKYINKNKLRMITFGNSSELCIGTHVNKTGLINVFKIISEKSISSGIRRIKAITSKKALIFLRNAFIKYKQIQIKYKQPEKYINVLRLENKTINKKLSYIYNKQIDKLKIIYTNLIVTNSVKYIFDINLYNKEYLDSYLVKKISILLIRKITNLFMFVGMVKNKKILFFIAISNNLIKEKNIHANKIMNHLFYNNKNGSLWGNSNLSGYEQKINSIKYKIKLQNILKYVKEYIFKQLY